MVCILENYLCFLFTKENVVATVTMPLTNTRLFITHVVKFTSVHRFNWVGIMWVMTMENCPSSLDWYFFAESRERAKFPPLKAYLKHKTLTCVRRVSPSPSPCPTAGASHFENEWEPPNSRLPKALAEYVRQLAISISPADRPSPATVLPQGERGLEGTVLAALWVQGQEKETSFLDSAGRVRETKGKGWGWCPKGPSSGPSPVPGGRPHQHRRRGARKEGGAVSRPGAELWMSFRSGGRSRPRLHPVSLPEPRRLNGKGTENGRRTGGAPGRAHQPGHLPQACQPVGTSWLS